MKKLNEFLPWIAPSAPGAPSAVIRRAVRDTCIDFCSRTNVIQTVETVSTVQGDPTCSLFPPPQQTLATVLAVTYLDQPLTPVAVDEVRLGSAMRAGVDSVVPTVRGTPRHYYQTTPSSTDLYLYPTPDVGVADSVAVRASFAPSRTATQVEDALLDDWLDAIVQGTLARLLSTPGQMYTSLTAAEDMQKGFGAAIASAAATARRGYTRAALRVQGRRFL